MKSRKRATVKFLVTTLVLAAAYFCSQPILRDIVIENTKEINDKIIDICECNPPAQAVKLMESLKTKQRITDIIEYLLLGEYYCEVQEATRESTSRIQEYLHRLSIGPGV